MGYETDASLPFRMCITVNYVYTRVISILMYVVPQYLQQRFDIMLITFAVNLKFALLLKDTHLYMNDDCETVISVCVADTFKQNCTFSFSHE